MSAIGVNAVRASALQKTEGNFSDPVLYSFDTSVPVPPHSQLLSAPVAQLDAAQIDLGWAHHGSPGGYKVPSLIGLFWTAPYLHDGGVAVGPDLDHDLGLPGTVQRNVAPDPANSMMAMIDRRLRGRVIAANAGSQQLVRMNVQGTGHNFWVDRDAGYSVAEQQALICFLLTYKPGH